LLYPEAEVDVAGSISSQGHNLIGVGVGGSGYARTDLVGTFASPVDARLGPLQDNGGLTWTMALLPGSPAIDAGGLTDSEWDQRGPGYARLVNGATDIGAYEVQESITPAGLPHAIPRGVPTAPPLVSAIETAASRPNLPLSQAVVAVDCVLASYRLEEGAMSQIRHRHESPAANWLDCAQGAVLA
jgi:hypothetical protein